MLVRAFGSDAVVMIGFLGDKDLPNGVCTGNEATPRLREFVESFEHGVYGSVCLSDFSPAFVDAVSVIDTACDADSAPSVAVTVACPACTARTAPSASTSRTAGSLDAHATPSAADSTPSVRTAARSVTLTPAGSAPAGAPLITSDDCVSTGGGSVVPVVASVPRSCDLDGSFHPVLWPSQPMPPSTTTTAIVDPYCAKRLPAMTLPPSLVVVREVRADRSFEVEHALPEVTARLDRGPHRAR